MKPIFKLVLTIAMAASLTSCLKTRAQLKEDTLDDKPQPAQVKEVHPQGSAYAIDEIKSEITRMNGRIEDVERKNQQSEAEGNKALKDELKKIETRIVELEQAQAEIIETMKKGGPVKTQDKTDLFEKGKARFKEKEYEEAIELFSAYLKNPGKLAEDAIFLRGEAHYQQKEYKKAIVDSSKFPEKYSKSKKMPVALLRIGQSFDALGMKDDARGFYQELAEKFPKSTEARKIRARLK